MFDSYRESPRDRDRFVSFLGEGDLEFLRGDRERGEDLVLFSKVECWFVGDFVTFLWTLHSFAYHPP